MNVADLIYLASQSPRRRQLLDQLGVRHVGLLPAAGAEAHAAEALESVLPGELPADYVQRITLLKLRAARARLKARALPEAPFGKAGAYAIQSQLAGWIAHIDGSYSAIMGLPLFETAQLLKQARVRF